MTNNDGVATVVDDVVLWMVFVEKSSGYRCRKGDEGSEQPSWWERERERERDKYKYKYICNLISITILIKAQSINEFQIAGMKVNLMMEGGKIRKR